MSEQETVYGVAGSGIMPLTKCGGSLIPDCG
jgi:hypothetical protein